MGMVIISITRENIAVLNASKKSGSSALTRQIKDWVRDFASVPEDIAILVTELTCTEPGCPPLETIVALLGPNGVKHQQKIHLAIEQITQAEAEKLSAKLKLQLAGIKTKEKHDHE
jgi:hypothetical protein